MAPPVSKGPAIVTTLLVSVAPGCWTGSPPPDPAPVAPHPAKRDEVVVHGVAVTEDGPVANTRLEITTDDGHRLRPVTTDVDGKFTVRIDREIFTLTVSAVGYQPATARLREGASFTVVFQRIDLPGAPMPQPVT